jgi:adenosylmethionine-8-amino-7-oxononanoate aminotransferase
MSKLLEDDQSYVWHPFTQHQGADRPLQVVKGDGLYLYDSDGKKYIDANSSWWVNVHGHSHPHIANAISKQFLELDHVVFAGVTHPKAVELSKRIVNILPDHFQKVFFSDNGSTAIEVAIKMSFQYWHNKGENRKRVMALEGAYHGDTFGAMSVGERDLFNKPFEPFFFDADYLPFPTGANDDQVLLKAESLFESNEFALLIVEPLVQGASGMRMYSPEFLDRLIKIARKFGVLVIFDEVMTGFGRTGKMFAMDHCELKPDLVALSKGLTGGVLPLGLTVASQEMFDAFLSDETARGFLHGHSFTGNPIACAAACASLDIFEREETTLYIERICNWNTKFLKELAKVKHVKNVRQQGTILAFEVESDQGDSYFSDIRNKAYRHFLANGILIRPLGNTIFINPPFCMKERDYTALRNGILDFLKSL